MLKTSLLAEFESCGLKTKLRRYRFPLNFTDVCKVGRGEEEGVGDGMGAPTCSLSQ